MQLIPHLHLRGGKFFSPTGAKPSWFSEEPKSLVHYFLEKRCEGLFITDLDIPNTGEGPNFKSIRTICDDTNLKLWVSGNFKTLDAIEPYDTAGVNKIIIGPAAYQNPNFFLEVLQKFGKSISTQINCKGGRVVIPGMVAPSHKPPLDYANRFQKDGVTALCFSDVSARDDLTAEEYKRTKNFCNSVQVPVLCTSEVTRVEDLEGLFLAKTSGMIGIVINKALYSGVIDIYST